MSRRLLKVLESILLLTTWSIKIVRPHDERTASIFLMCATRLKKEHSI